jgi:hypothetical protein
MTDIYVSGVQRVENKLNNLSFVTPDMLPGHAIRSTARHIIQLQCDISANTLEIDQYKV